MAGWLDGCPFGKLRVKLLDGWMVGWLLIPIPIPIPIPIRASIGGQAGMVILFLRPLSTCAEARNITRKQLLPDFGAR